MKRMMISMALAGCVMASPLAMAANQTVSLGYAHSKVDKAFGLDGVNLQYNYELTSGWGVMGSFTWMKGDQNVQAGDWSADADGKYYSLMVGPSYRFNDWVSVYGALGLVKTDVTENIYYNGDFRQHSSVNSTSVAWGVGVMFNPLENLSVNVGYEGTRVDYWDQKYAINGFNVGIGYRF